MTGRLNRCATGGLIVRPGPSAGQIHGSCSGLSSGSPWAVGAGSGLPILRGFHWASRCGRPPCPSWYSVWRVGSLVEMSRAPSLVADTLDVGLLAGSDPLLIGGGDSRCGQVTPPALRVNNTGAEVCVEVSVQVLAWQCTFDTTPAPLLPH